jgi:small nuclear ribonucleoprotein G
MDLRVDLKLNGERRVVGIMKGYDQFMNIVLDEAIEIKGKNNSNANEQQVDKRTLGTIVIRGSSIVLWENIDKVQ